MQKVNPKKENAKPDAGWTDEQLTAYVREHFGFTQFFAHKTAVQYWLVGQAAIILQARLTKERRWTIWLKELGIPHSTIYQAIRIAKEFPDWNDVSGIPLKDVKKAAGLTKNEPPNADAVAEKAPNGNGTKKPTPDNRSQSLASTQPSDERPIVDSQQVSSSSESASESETDTRQEPRSPDELAATYIRDAHLAVVALVEQLPQTTPTAIPLDEVCQLITLLRRVFDHAATFAAAG